MGSPLKLADETDFMLGGMKVSPSACRVIVGAQEVRVGALTMSALVVLARAAGATVTREDLVSTCWRGRVVSDDAVARTVAKVRALGRTTSAFTLETVPKIGYRLVPAEVQPSVSQPMQENAANVAPAKMTWRKRHVAVVASIAAIGLAGLVFGAATFLSQHSAQASITRPAQPVNSGDVMEALMNLDEPRLRSYLQAGWNPNWHLDSESNAALHQLMMVCERNPAHDRAALLHVAQVLVEAGENPTARNGWGDTPLVIARARRYCGPDHPVVAYLSAASEAYARTHPEALVPPPPSLQSARQRRFAVAVRGKPGQDPITLPPERNHH